MIIGAPFVVYGTQCRFVILMSERRAELSNAVLLGGFMHRRHFDGGFHFSTVSTLFHRGGSGIPAGTVWAGPLFAFSHS